MSNSFISYIKSGKANRATSIIETALKNKIMDSLTEERKRVASVVFAGVNEASTDPHPLHKMLTKGGYSYKGPGTTTTGGGTNVARHDYTHANGHKMELGSVTKKDGAEPQHFWNHTHGKTGAVRNHGMRSLTKMSSLKHHLKKQVAESLAEAELTEKDWKPVPKKTEFKARQGSTDRGRWLRQHNDANPDKNERMVVLPHSKTQKMHQAGTPNTRGMEHPVIKAVVSGTQKMMHRDNEHKNAMDRMDRVKEKMTDVRRQISAAKAAGRSTASHQEELAKLANRMKKAAGRTAAAKTAMNKGFGRGGGMNKPNLPEQFVSEENPRQSKFDDQVASYKYRYANKIPALETIMGQTAAHLKSPEYVGDRKASAEQLKAMTIALSQLRGGQ